MDEDFEYVNEHGAIPSITLYTLHVPFESLVVLRRPPVLNFYTTINQTISEANEQY
jgi:hypothetical protein